MSELRDASPRSDAASGDSEDYFAMRLGPGDEPVVTGTMFLVIIILMIIGAVWVIMYLRLLDR
jgi:hypothetical protein